jgi:hypothetical protein
VIVAGMLGHSISILLTTYAHYIPNLLGEAAPLMDDILTPVQIDFDIPNNQQKSKTNYQQRTGSII